MRSSSPRQTADAASTAAQAQEEQGDALRVPPQLLKGARKHEEQPCLTPIDCVLENRCAGHCGCR